MFSERPIDKADILLTARVIGGLRMIDDGEADDKIVSVLANDPVFDHANDVQDLPVNMVDRLDHYFRTYKAVPGAAGRVKIEARYGMTDACAVVEAAIADYGDKFSSVAS